MKNLLVRIERKVLLLALSNFYFKRFSRYIYKRLGVNDNGYYYLSPDIEIRGDYSNLTMGENSTIREGSFITLNREVSIGKNTGVAFQVTILTAANPNGPLNLLSKVYKKVREPVIIGDNTWIGARATILPGVKIGNFCIVAAGSVVNKNVPDYTVVAGVPAKPVKQLTPSDFE